MRLFIAEKPSMAMDIARALGRSERRNGYFEVGNDCVTFAVGHLLGQANPEEYGEQYAKERPWSFDTLPIVPTTWKMIVYPKTKDQLTIIGTLLKSADSVVHCGDAAREGQMIVDELLQHFDYKGNVKRLWLHSMTPDAIRTSLKQMKDNREYANVMASAVVRSRTDWLTGMNLTRAFSIPWKRSGHTGALHIGRVKTPTLSFVVERELFIRNFVPKDYFVVRCEVAHENGSFIATWQPAPNSDFLDEDGKIINKLTAETMAAWFQDMPSEIRAFETQSKSVQPPLPFSLGDLQKEANTLLGLTPSQTLEIAQSLYEKHKLTSYPRTAFNHLPEEEFKQAETLILAAKSNYGPSWPFAGKPDFSIKSGAWNSKKIGDHHAIRPTERSDCDLATLSKHELAIYRLVVRNFLAQFYPPYRYDATSVAVDCEGETLNATGQVPKAPGWKALFGAADIDDDSTSALPAMQAGDLVVISKASVDSKKTTPPPRYTGASLIDAMERAHLHISDESLKAQLKGVGIGTPATRAGIVDELVTQEYLGIEKKYYVPSERAMAAYAAIPNILRKPDSTAMIEDSLTRIENGELDPKQFLDRHVKEITGLIEAAKKTVISSLDTPNNGNAQKSPACPKCGNAMRERKSARGSFWGCLAYPECKGTINIEAAPLKGRSPTTPKSPGRSTRNKSS